MPARPSSGVVKRIAKRQSKTTSVYQESIYRAEKIYEACNPVQQKLIDDKSKRKAARCPRRSGKTYAASSLALHLGESKPGARILIVSLTLKSTKENYWTRGPGGIFAQDQKFDLGLKYNLTEHTWYHQNGSTGMLAGAETRADIEKLRGATAEADLIIVDECKSFSPLLFEELLRDVLIPGLMTRQGTLMLIGTPGNIPIGPFYEATEPTYRKKRYEGDEGVPTCLLYTGKVLQGKNKLWSLHTWTIQDNVAVPGQWEYALEIKEQNHWTDQTPVWRREYLGEWVTDTKELVYAFAAHRNTGAVLWEPDVLKYKPHGLNPDDGPWQLIMGLDFGYEDHNAIVLCAYSETKKELRHIYDFKQNHMTIDQFGMEIQATIERYGTPSVIVGDKGSLGGILYLQELNSRFGLGVIPAEKKEKYDHIELLNSDFASGRVKIIPDSDLDHELCALQWDLSKSDKERLVRTGKLREDPSCSNHLCDALLYLWRYCYHYWSESPAPHLHKDDPDYWRVKEREMIDKYREKLTRERELMDKIRGDVGDPWL